MPENILYIYCAVHQKRITLINDFLPEKNICFPDCSIPLHFVVVVFNENEWIYKIKFVGRNLGVRQTFFCYDPFLRHMSQKISFGKNSNFIDGATLIFSQNYEIRMFVKS